MPRIAEAARAARRDQIIAAAQACFSRSGYHATTMADIAERAGVSKGTPYLYFDGKQALFLALHEEWNCGASDRVNAAVAALPEAGRNSPRRILQVIAAAIAAHVQAESQTCQVLMEVRALASHEPAIGDAVRTGDARIHQQLEGLIAAGVAAGEWPAGTDPALTARLLTAGLHGLMAQWHLVPGSFSWDAAAAALAGAWTEPRQQPSHHRQSPAPPLGTEPGQRRITHCPAPVPAEGPLPAARLRALPLRPGRAGTTVSAPGPAWRTDPRR